MTPFYEWGSTASRLRTATSRRQFTFYHSVPRNSWYSIPGTQSFKVVLKLRLIKSLQVIIPLLISWTMILSSFQNFWRQLRCIFKTSIYDGMYFWGNILQLKSGNYFCKRIFNWDVSHGPDYATATPTQPSMKIMILL